MHSPGTRMERSIFGRALFYIFEAKNEDIYNGHRMRTVTEEYSVGNMLLDDVFIYNRDIKWTNMMWSRDQVWAVWESGTGTGCERIGLRCRLLCFERCRECWIQYKNCEVREAIGTDGCDVVLALLGEEINTKPTSNEVNRWSLYILLKCFGSGDGKLWWLNLVAL